MGQYPGGQSVLGTWLPEPHTAHGWPGAQRLVNRELHQANAGAQSAAQNGFLVLSAHGSPPLSSSVHHPYTYANMCVLHHLQAILRAEG